MKRTVVVALAAAASLSLGACMEVEQTATAPKAGKYQGKPDTPPWANEPLALENAPRWTKGDRASWETQIKNRQLAQHEDRRIYQ
ncbi:MAG: hypothetical protein N2653_04990 [Burkholderiales bacterium]|nr:hypothetical protein [Burkholderiales bacterium]